MIQRLNHKKTNLFHPLCWERDKYVHGKWTLQIDRDKVNAFFIKRLHNSNTFDLIVSISEELQTIKVFSQLILIL